MIKFYQYKMISSLETSSNESTEKQFQFDFVIIFAQNYSLINKYFCWKNVRVFFKFKDMGFWWKFFSEQFLFWFIFPKCFFEGFFHLLIKEELKIIVEFGLILKIITN